MKEKIRCFLMVMVFLGILYIWGLTGSVQWDKITVGQALVRGVTACTFMTAALLVYKRIDES